MISAILLAETPNSRFVKTTQKLTVTTRECQKFILLNQYDALINVQLFIVVA